MKDRVIIEIGTNSIKTLHAKLEASDWRVVSQNIYPTRIGERAASSNSISADVMERNLQAIGDILSGYYEEQDIAFEIIATESLRKPANAAEFISAVKQRFGLDIQVITGKEEAELACLAGAYYITDQDKTAAILDIGGGSTELTLLKGGQILLQTSLPWGAVSLTNQYFGHKHQNELILPSEINTLHIYLHNELAKLPTQEVVTQLIAIGGTVTTLASLEGFSYQEMDGIELAESIIRNRIEHLTGLTNEEKQNLPGMPRGRGDIILAGVLILDKILQHFGLKQFTVSVRGVRYGWMLKHWY
jgi:exopolyphosphatase / guanosine-5'-triphosphate,3'-diphosphate pyrophosphatase